MSEQEQAAAEFSGKTVDELRAMPKPVPQGLALLRVPFPEHQISKLPKPTGNQTDELKKDRSKGIRCKLCGGWHHKDAIHLDYVGHAALTDRLLDADPKWNWRPMAMTESGAPALEQNGGLWIELTVCGVSRFGYGHADGKTGGDAIKEAIGDAMRNAAMRFGAALDLWHKGKLHEDEEPEEPETPEAEMTKTDCKAIAHAICNEIKACKSLDELVATWKSERVKAALAQMQTKAPDHYKSCIEHKDKAKAKLTAAEQASKQGEAA